MNVSRLAIFLGAFYLARLSHAAPPEEIVSRIKRVPVLSSNVASVGYSSRLHALEVEFVRGAIYRFLEVPPRVYRDLLAADSKGRYINKNVCGKFRFVRVRAREMAPRGDH